MKYHSYKLRVGGRHKANYWPSVIVLLIIIFLIAAFARITKVQAEDEANIKVEAIKEVNETMKKTIMQVAGDNISLKGKLEQSAKVTTSDTTRVIAREYIHKYFPRSEWEKAEKMEHLELLVS